MNPEDADRVLETWRLTPNEETKKMCAIYMHVYMAHILEPVAATFAAQAIANGGKK